MLTINTQFNHSAAGASAGRSRKGLGFWYGMLGRALEEDRGRRGEPPSLSADEVFAWGTAFLGRTGDWPDYTSGPIPEAPRRNMAARRGSAGTGAAWLALYRHARAFLQGTARSIQSGRPEAFRRADRRLGRFLAGSNG